MHFKLLVGTAGADTLTGTEGSDLILGGEGDDTITGGGGVDVLRGGSGDDNISGGDDTDIIRGDSGDDTINGDAGNDTLVGDAGNDTINGGTGDDTITGGSGNDMLTGGAGADTFVFIGATGNNTIKDFNTAEDIIDLSMLPNALGFDDLTLTATADGTGTVISHADLGGTITVEGVAPTAFTAEMFDLPDGNTTSVQAPGALLQLWENPIEGTANPDFILDGANDTRILGHAGDDFLLGGEGDDRLEGGADDDWLAGQEGDDTLVGGTGDDSLYGGSGVDTFVFEAGHGDDMIADFENGTDLIDLSALTNITAFSDLTITADGDDVVIDLSSQGGGEIRIEDTPLADIDATDFVFHDPGDG